MSTTRHKAIRIRPRAHPPATSHRAGIFTAVDGTLLDARTFDGRASRAAVRRLAAAGVPVVPVSVMTLDELRPIAADFGFRHAMIIEAGGAIARWSGSDWEVEACGPPADTLLNVIREIEDRSGANLLVYSAMDEAEASRVSGRSGEMFEASIRRRFSEPFIIESGRLEAVKRAAASIGFSVRAGRRFLHLCRECDEGEAFTRVRDELRCEVTIAVGGAPVDAEFLSRADVAIVIPGPNGEADPELLAAIPQARVASSPAPEGWATAVDELYRAVNSSKQGRGNRRA